MPPQGDASGHHHHVVILGFMPRIHGTEFSYAEAPSRELGPRDKPEDDSEGECRQPAASSCSGLASMLERTTGSVSSGEHSSMKR